MVNTFGPGHYVDTGQTTSRPSQAAPLETNDSWFQECDPNTPNSGTSYDALWANPIIANMRYAVRKSGAAEAVTGAAADDMLGEAMARYASGGVYCLYTGTANAHVLAGSGLFIMPKSYFDGLMVHYDPVAVNTGAATADAFGLGAKPIVKVDATALTGGELRAPTVLRYSTLSGGRWVLMPWSGLQFALESVRYRLPGNNTNVVQTFTTIPFSVGTLPSFATLSGGIFTLTRAGTYLVTGVLFSDWASNFSLNLVHNGGYAFGSAGSSGGNGASISVTATIHKAVKGDTIQAWSWFNTGGVGSPTVLQTRVITPLTGYTELTITRIAD